MLTPEETKKFWTFALPQGNPSTMMKYYLSEASAGDVDLPSHSQPYAGDRIFDTREEAELEAEIVNALLPPDANCGPYLVWECQI